MKDASLLANTDLYATDLSAWCETTAALIRQGYWEAIDLEALAEEIESVGKSQLRELENRLEQLVMHLLKWVYQPIRREDSHSWYDSIMDQRNQIPRLLRDNPSLRPQVQRILDDIYPDARLRALGDGHRPGTAAAGTPGREPPCLPSALPVAR